jgi:NAD(P)-dependent dehydrogenase (short-subunit alcohol dehydrogenase family)
MRGRVAVVTGRSMDAAERTVGEIAALGGEAIVAQCDVTVEAQVRAMVRRVVETFGRIDAAFNNAGVGPDGVSIPFKPLHELEERHWDAVLNTDMMPNFGAYGPAKGAVVLLSKLAALENRGYGIRVNVVCPGPTRGSGMMDRMMSCPGGAAPPPPPQGWSGCHLLHGVSGRSDHRRRFLHGDALVPSLQALDRSPRGSVGPGRRAAGPLSPCHSRLQVT